MAQVVYDSLQYLTESDTQAMAMYLKSLARSGAPDDPLQIRPTEGPGKAAFEAGAKIYDTSCKSCHGGNGLSVPPMYPPLANNKAINMEFSVNPIRMVLFGGFPPATRGNPFASHGEIAERPSMRLTCRSTGLFRLIRAVRAGAWPRRWRAVCLENSM
jgi:hypothetical protein